MKSLHLYIPGTPPTVNTLWRTCNKGGKQWTYKTKKGKQYHDLMHEQIPAWFTPIQGRCEVRIFFYFPGKRKRDIDNYIKSILDGLNGQAFEDDEQIDVLIAEKLYECKVAHVEIKVLEMR